MPREIREIETRKRLRTICEWFDGLNERAAASQPENGLSPEVVAEISAQGFDRGDLMAIRQTPYMWALKDPYKWLWILHRYQNKYQTHEKETHDPH
jgi:hypothetical protein